MSMDEIRSTLFSAGLRRLLTQTLQPGERVLWQGQPDAVADMMMWRFLWWTGFPWLLLTAIAISRGWIDQSAMFFLMSGAIMVAAPAVLNGIYHATGKMPRSLPLKARNLRA